MANPLTFEFGIKDNLSAKLEEIEKKLGKLQEGVAVNIRLGDVGSIKELFDNLDPSKINNITEAIKNLNRAMNVVVDKQGSFKTVQQFVDAEQAARNLASAVEKIDFGKVDSTGKISNMTNEMKAFRDALRDYNEKMANVQPFKAELSTQALAEFKSSIDKTLSGISVKLGVELDNNTITKDFGIYKGINEAIKYLKDNFSTVNAEVAAPKVDTTALDAAEKKVAELRKELADLQGEPVKPTVDSSQVNLLSRQIADAETSLKRLQEQETHATASFDKFANARSEAMQRFTQGKWYEGADMNGITSSVGVGAERQFEMLREYLAKSLKITEEYKTALRGNLADAFRFMPMDSSVTKKEIEYLQELYDKAKLVKDSIKGSDKSLSPDLLGQRNDAKQQMEAASELLKLYKELAKEQDNLAKIGKKEGWSDGKDLNYYAEGVIRAKKELDALIAKKAELEKAPSAHDNSARINQINEQIAAQEKLIAENKKAQEQMKAPQQEVTPFNAFSQGFTLAATEIYNAYNTIEKKLREVREALGETGFTNLKTKAEAAAEAIQKLAKAFEQLGVSTKTNEKLTEMVIGLGEIVRTIRRAIPQGANGSDILGDFSVTTRNNLNTIEKKLLDIQDAKQKLESAKRVGAENGMMSGEIRHIETLMQMLSNLERQYIAIKNDSAKLATVGSLSEINTPGNNLLISNKPNNALQQAREYETATNRMRDALLQIDSMRQRLALKHTAGKGIINTDEIDNQMRKLEDFTAKLMGVGNVKTRVKVFGGEWSQMSKQMEGVLQRSERLIENTKKYNNNLDAGTVVVERLRNAIQNASDPKLSIDTTAAQNALAKIEQWMQKLSNVDFNNPNAFVGLERQFKKLKSEGNNAAKEIERAFNRATTTKDSYGDISHQIEFMKRQMLSISDLMAKAGKFNIDTTALVKFNSELEKSIRMLEQAQASGNKKQMSSAWLSSKTISDQATTEQRRVQNEVNKAKADGAISTQKLTAEEQKLADAIKNATNAGKQQNQVLSDLRTMAMQYWSVQGIYNFAKEMANITGELELQKTSLQVILNNASKADELYGQIRDLSQMSPFSFMDLMKSTRQLAAFGIETKDLYGTMKSLSDIGAGLNVDVNRLILAYGHTRSYGYLSGIQNRQFENAGIDMIGGLVKKYNELAEAEKKAGREAEYVSRKDIFKKMRNREIGFGMVEDVVMDLDRPGGKFYNMQEKQFDTLGGKLRNLANNYNIMMSELGEKNRGVLMFAVEALTEVHENWRRYERIIYGVVAALGAMKAAQLAVGASAMSMNRAVSKFNLQNKKDIVSTAALKSLGQGNGPFRAEIAMRKEGYIAKNIGVSDAVLKKEIIDNEKLTALQKQRIALTGKLSQAQRAQVLQATGLNAVEAKRIAGMNKLNRGLIAMRLNIQSVAMSLKAFAASFAPMAAITAIIALFMKFNEAAEQAKNIKEAFKNDSQKDLEGLREAISTYEKSGAVTTTTTSKMYSNGSVSVPVQMKFDTNKIKEMGVTEVFDELQRTLQSQSPLYQGDMFDIVKAGDQMKQIEAMFKRLKDIDFVKQMEQIHADALGDAIEETGAKWYNVIGWFTKGEGIATNFGDFSKANKEFVKAFKVDDTVFDGIDKEYKDAINNLKESASMTRDEAIAKFVVDLQKQNKSAALKLTRQLLGGNKDTLLIKRNVQLDEASGDMNPVAEHMAAAFADMNTDQATIYFEDAMNKIFTEAKVGDEDSRSVLRLKMAEAIKASMPEDEGAEFFNNVLKKNIGALVLENINGRVNQNTKASELPNIVNESFDKAIKTIKARTPEYAEAYAEAGKEGEKAFKEAAVNAAKRIMAMEDWQARAKKMNVTLDVTMDTDYTTFIDKQRKELKEKLEKFTKNQKRIKWIVGADLKLELNAKSVKEALKKLTGTYNELAKKESDTIRTKRDKNGLIHGEDWKNVQQIRGQRETLKEMIDNLKTMARIGDYMDEEHQSWKDDTKNKGNQKDPMQEMWRNRIKYIQEAYNAYKQWKKEVGNNDVNGDDPAMKIVDNKFGKYLKEAFGKDFDLKNIKEYQKFLKEMMKMVENTIFKQKDTKRNFLSQLEGMYSQTELAVIQEKSKEVADAFKQNITDIEKKYEMFRSIIEVTGDTDLASRMLGYDYQWQNKANIIKRELDKVLENAGLVGKIDIGSNTSDTDIDRIVKANMNTVDEKGNPIESEIEKVNEVIEALKKFRDVTQDVMKDSISQYTELIKSATGYQQKITDIETEYKKALEALKGINDETERNRAEGIARDKRDTALMEASAPYRNLMSNSLTTSKEDAKKAYATAYAQYSQNFKDGVIGADEYTKKIQELNKALRDIDNGAVSEWILFLQGGMKAVREQRIKQDDEIIASAMRDKEVAQKEYDDAKAKGDAKAMGIALGNMAKADSRKNTAQKDKDENEGKIDKNEKFSKGVNAVVDGLNKFNSGLNLVNSTLDALGLGDTAIGNAAKDASTIMNSAMQGAQALSAFGPWGQAAGAALGIVGGIMQVHDAKLERQITELKQDVSKIENYNKTIAKSAERQLGYSRTSNVSAFAKMYSNDGSAAGRAMAEYYRNASGSGSYTTYQQEYNNAIEERKKYLEMYNAEEAKKKTDTNALEEYKSKIAELDDQIRYFAEDTAKELWGIDVKSWADQLSDALSTAWQNGTSLAIAYGDTVKSILQSVAKQMLTIGIIQPMFEELQSTIFGKDGKDGLFDINNPEQSMAKVTDYLAKYFGDGGNGQKTITAANEFWNGIEQVLNQYGMSAKNSGSSTLSSGIKGMSEETANLLAGYVNALRQDVSAMRIMQAEFFKRYWEVRESGNYDDTNTILAEGKRYDLSTVNNNTSAILVLETVFVNQYWNDYVQTYTAAYKSLGNIEQQVAAMARVQTQMSDTLSDFYSKFNRVTNGTEHLYIK